jgi:hypothetical protein
LRCAGRGGLGGLCGFGTFGSLGSLLERWCMWALDRAAAGEEPSADISAATSAAAKILRTGMSRQLLEFLVIEATVSLPRNRSSA